MTLEEADSGLFVLENGTEFSLTPLNNRKSAFEPPPVVRRRRPSSPIRLAAPGFGLSFARGGARVRQEAATAAVVADPLNYVKSSNLPYIEAEKGVLQNINIVHSAKRKFLKS